MTWLAVSACQACPLGVGNSSTFASELQPLLSPSLSVVATSSGGNSSTSSSCRMPSLLETRSNRFKLSFSLFGRLAYPVHLGCKFSCKVANLYTLKQNSVINHANSIRSAKALGGTGSSSSIICVVPRSSLS